MRHRRVHRRAGSGAARARGTEAARVPRLRLRRARGRERRPGNLPNAGEDRRARARARGDAAGGNHRDRAHPLGDARRADRGERPPTRRLRRHHRPGAQRHHRKCRRAAPGALRPRPRVPLPDRHGSALAPDRGDAHQGNIARRCDRGGATSGGRCLRHRRHLEPRAGHARRSAAWIAAARRDRQRRKLGGVRCVRRARPHALGRVSR